MFFKKAKNVDEKIQAVDERISEIQKEIVMRDRHVSEKKAELAAILGDLALDPANQEAQGLLTRGKKALSRQEEEHSDLKTQLDFLRKERVKLDKELLEAKLRDIPAQAEEAAESFNKILGECLASAEVLKTFHGKLKAAEDNFVDLCRQHQDAASKLGIIKGLELKTGLGELAFIPGPYSMSFQTPNFFSFLGNLEAYRLKVADYEQFKQTNPTYEKDIAETQARDTKRGEMDFSNQRGVKTFSPASH